MSEAPKSIWKRSGPRWAAQVAWLVVTVTAFWVVTATAVWFAWLSWALTGFHYADWLVGPGIWPGVVVLAACLACLYLDWVLLRLLLRHWRQTLLGLACFASLVVLCYAEEDWRDWRAWENFKRECAARGQSFDLKSVVPPTVPDDQNFALTPIAFSTYGYILTRDGKPIPYERRNTNLINRLNLPLTAGYRNTPTNGIGNWQKAVLTDLTPWQVYYRKLASTTNLFPVAPQPKSPAADVLLALSKYDPTIEELRTAAALPGARFPLDYDNEFPAAILLPHLSPLKTASQLLQMRALAELQDGDTQKALDDVKLILRLADSIKDEPIYFSHLVRIRMLQIALQPVYEGLAAHHWSDAQLAELDSALAKEDFVAGYLIAMRGDIVFQYREIEYLRRHPHELNKLSFADDNFFAGDDNFSQAAPPSPGWLIPAACFCRLSEVHCAPVGWFYQNEVRCARQMMDHYLPIADVRARTLSPAKAKAAESAFRADVQQVTPHNFFERLLLPALRGGPGRFARAQSSVDLARAAVGLERYRLAHGGFPESLDALALQYLGSVPRDVVNGRPLIYRREADGGFVLYSIGWNETDDGGTVVLDPGPSQKVDPKQGDWVWRYPKHSNRVER
jgi:hypothetical protein